MKADRFHLSREKIGALPALDRWGVAIQEFPAFVPPTTSNLLHTHDFLEMFLVRQGEGIHRFAGGERPLRPGTLAIIHRHQAHGFVSRTPHLHLINIYFDLERFAPPALPPPLDNALPHILPLHQSFGHRLRQITHMEFSNPETLSGLLLLLRDELDAAESEPPESGIAFFLSLCCRGYLKRQREKPSRTLTSATTRERVERLRQHLDTHFHEPTDLTRLAKMAGLQPHYLCRLFKAHTGESIFSYLTHRRLEKCLMHLRQSSLKVVEIALACGFNDLPHFNRLFKREMKMSPLDYRRQWVDRRRGK